MAAILDQTGDTGLTQWHRITKLYDVPEFVKRASAEMFQLRDPASGRETATADLPTHVFADVRNRQFPVNTKVATWLSWAYFLEKRAELPAKLAGWIQDRLEAMAQWHGLAAEVHALKERHTELYKSAEDLLPDSQFAVVLTQEDGRKERQLPLRSPAEVKAAAIWFASQRDVYPYAWRQKIATRIQARARETGARLGEYATFIERTSGDGFTSPQKAATVLRARAHSLPHGYPEIRDGLLKLADQWEAAPALCRDKPHVCKLAETLDNIDRTFGFVRRYDDDLSRPEDALFEVTYKEAEATRAACCGLRTGQLYAVEDLRHLDLEDVRGVLGDKVAEQVETALGGIDPEKMAAVAAELPYQDARLLDALLNDARVMPVARQPHQQPRLRPAELVAASAGYGL